MQKTNIKASQNPKNCKKLKPKQKFQKQQQTKINTYFTQNSLNRFEGNTAKPEVSKAELPKPQRYKPKKKYYAKVYWQLIEQFIRKNMKNSKFAFPKLKKAINICRH